VLGIPTGTQDHRAALNGGVVVIHHDPEGARVYRAAGRLLAGLNARLILVDTGAARSSAPSNWDMFRRRIDGDPDATAALDRVARAGRAAADALAAEDWTALGHAMSEDLEARAAWSPLVVTEPLAHLFTAVREAGALGARVCGAGGGGFAVILCDPEERARIAAAAAAAVAPAGGAVAARVRPVARGLQLRIEPPGRAGPG
jgi:D-glycero-alpha-D-manno-heptose-7-phosphate kinase